MTRELQSPDNPLLNRSQAATYVGVRGESSIRAAEAKGLPCRRDGSGQAWYEPAALDAWRWRSKRPSDTVRAGVLRDAAKGERSPQSLRIAAGRELAAMYKAADRADALEAKVARENEAARAAFLRDNIEDTDARELLFAGDERSEARQKFRDVLRHKLLTEVRVPMARVVEGVHESAAEIEAPWPVVWGGPFFARAEVLELRRETLQLARERPEVVGPAPVTPAPLKTLSPQNVRDILTLWLSMAGAKDRQNPPSQGP